MWNTFRANYRFHNDKEEDDDDLVDFSLPLPGLKYCNQELPQMQVKNAVLKEQKPNLIRFYTCSMQRKKKKLKSSNA